MNRQIRVPLTNIVSSALFALVVFASSAAGAWNSPQGTFDKTLSVSGPVDLEVLTHSGDVRIHGGSSGSVQIHARIYVGDRWFGGKREDDVHAIEQNPPIRQDGNNVRIDYVNYHNIAIDYDITVPEQPPSAPRAGPATRRLKARAAMSR